MKKEYVKPAAEVIALQTEGMIAASNIDNPGKYDEEGNGKQQSKGLGWSSDSWTGTADDED